MPFIRETPSSLTAQVIDDLYGDRTVPRFIEGQNVRSLHGVHPNQTFAPPANALTNC
jgi:hypothetical protein